MHAQNYISHRMFVAALGESPRRDSTPARPEPDVAEQAVPKTSAFLPERQPEAQSRRASFPVRPLLGRAAAF